MRPVDLVVGKPIKTSDERAEQIGPAQGIPIFGLDGLSSAAYGPEAALSLLIPLGLLGVRSEEHTSELQSQSNLVCRLLLEKKKNRLYCHITRSTTSSRDVSAPCTHTWPSS